MDPPSIPKILRLDAEGTTFRFKTETKYNNYEFTTMSQNIQVKACIVYEDPFDVVVVVFVLERATKLRSY